MDDLLFPAEGLGTQEEFRAGVDDRVGAALKTSVNSLCELGGDGANDLDLQIELKQSSETTAIAHACTADEGERKDLESLSKTETGYSRGPLQKHAVASSAGVDALALATSLGTHYKEIGLVVPPSGEEQGFTPRGRALLDYWRNCNIDDYEYNVGALARQHAVGATHIVSDPASIASPAGTVRDHQVSASPEPATTYPIFRIVLTGGPCAGKTTAMALLAERFRSRGFRVFLVPEAATLLFTGGAGQADIARDSERRILFQSILARFQMTMEDGFYALAKHCGAPAIILCDRGLLDGRAYMSGTEFAQMLDCHSWNLIEMRDQRYDAVLHLVTAADGAESYYTCEGHAARSENLEEARRVDYRTREAWSGHPRLYVIENRNAWQTMFTKLGPNPDGAVLGVPSQTSSEAPSSHTMTPSPSFTEKMERLFAVVCRLVGLPSPANMLDRKYLLATGQHLLSQLQMDPHVRGLQTFRVEQTFLIRVTPKCQSSGCDPCSKPAATSVSWANQEEHVRRRGRDGFHSYTHCIRRRYWESNQDGLGAAHHHRQGSWVELRRNISAQEYSLLLGYADPKHRDLLVWRSCFFYDDAYFVLDRVENANGGPVALLRTSASSLARASFSDAPPKYHLPLADCVLREVTSEPGYTFYAMSRHDTND
ncbi:hypothetical protein F1559_000192 [Cyanidiococcus yangmingshanensis]|uniref:NadR/Ttd14 AAA domain-containing protein n=1 Tax=Cyanidiococcus yangmingshanensis TaxID=2690220 RepID=A0A7J7IDZ4_9RHOD|nr:hypothetical protein F1559_000192 [Cyanidiococcus yangmingshanensis]